MNDWWFFRFFSRGIVRLLPNQNRATSAVRKATSYVIPYYPLTTSLISDASGHSYSLATAPPPPLVVAVVVVAGAAARVVPSATAVVRPGTSRATAQMRPLAAAAADADTVVVVVVVVAMAASAAEAKRATPVGVLDTFLGTVFKGASATTAAGR